MHQGKYETSSPFNSLEKSSDPDLARNKLLEYVAKRDHSEKELRTKLSRRFENIAIEAAIQTAHERNWIADPEDLSERVARRLHDKGKGARHIANYLQEKGLPPVSSNPELEKEKALQLLTIKYGDLESLSFEERQKAYRFLANRGYDVETIKSVIEQE